MNNKKKTYKFAFQTASFITVFCAILVVLAYFLLESFSAVKITILLGLLFIFTMILIQYRIENFIFKRLKKLFDEVSILDSTSLQNQTVTTDISSLSKDIKKFAKEKKIEIESLKIREEYRREFLGNISHELKTPLFTVQGYLETLIEGGAINDKELAEKYISRANIGVERLINIVQDLDMITKFETADLSLNLETFDIVKEIQHVFDLLEIKADEKNIILMFDEKYIKPIIVKADKEKIHQVLINLIMNAIKYGKNNGTTEIVIDEINQNKILIRIQDNGQGIEKQYISRIFERFFRVNNSGSREQGGSGLGLAIVKHIIEAHNEKILVQSTFNKGSEFSFTLKRSKN